MIIHDKNEEIKSPVLIVKAIKIVNIESVLFKSVMINVSPKLIGVKKYRLIPVRLWNSKVHSDIATSESEATAAAKLMYSRYFKCNVLVQALNCTMGRRRDQD